MNKINIFLIGAILAALGVNGCSSGPQLIEIGSDQALISISAIDPADWRNAAQKCIDSLLESGALKRANGEQSIVMISRIRNYTYQHIDSQILTAKVREAINISKQAMVTSAVGNQSNLDLAVRRIRDKENDDLFNAKTVPKAGTVIAPNMSLSGSIIQQTTYAGRTEESYFIFTLTLTDLTTGLAVWEKSVDVLKQGTHPIF